MIMSAISIDVSSADINEGHSDEGLYTIRAQAEPSRPVVGNNTITLTVFDRRTKAKVEGAVIEVTPWMTMHSHGSSKKTRVREKGNGVYAVEDVYFTMEGDWDLLIKIQKNGISDSAILTVRGIKK